MSRRVGDPAAEATGPVRDATGLVRDVNGHRPRVCIIVQNLSVPFDRRVWLECQALTARGYDVSVVCPKGKGSELAEEVLQGVRILRYAPYSPGGSKLSFVYEYLYSFAMTLRLVLRARRRGRFAVLQACNPPDIFWPIGRLLSVLDRTQFVFDHHDLCPELFESRFDGRPSLVHRALLLNERMTMRTAKHVISTNDSYRAIATTRGGKAPDDVTVVRTGPDPERLKRQQPDPAIRRGHARLAAYIGVMGPQDGVDIVVRAAAEVVHGMGRTDVGFVLIGSGDCFDELTALRDELGLQDHVFFTGRIPDDEVKAILSTADVGLSPDPLNPLNDVSTMNKTMEYMAFGLPVVAFDLKETKVSAKDAAVYVEPNEVDKYAESLVALLDDEPRRAHMGALGRQRVVSLLAWAHQAARYVQVYDRLCGFNVGHLVPSQRVAADRAKTPMTAS